MSEFKKNHYYGKGLYSIKENIRKRKKQLLLITRTACAVFKYCGTRLHHQER
jgi:hypothetical protein